MFSLDFEGLPQLQQTLQRFASQAEAALVQAIQVEAERILEASILLVPVDTTALVTSGIVEEQDDGAEIRYGAHGQVPYALIQHESVEMNHPGGGQHHYLSQPFLEATGDMAQRLGADLMARLRP